MNQFILPVEFPHDCYKISHLTFHHWSLSQFWLLIPVTPQSWYFKLSISITTWPNIVRAYICFTIWSKWTFMWISLMISTIFTKTFAPDIPSDHTTSVTTSYPSDSPSDGLSSLQILFPTYTTEEGTTLVPISDPSDSLSAELSKFPFIFLSELPLYDIIPHITCSQWISLKFNNFIYT